MTNPNNAVGTDGAYGGRTSVNAFNDTLAAYARGIMSGWECIPNTGLNLYIGGTTGRRDVAIAEDDAGNKTTINNISEQPINITISPAPLSNSRIDLIVGYVDSSPQGTSDEVDNPGACGLIVVKGTVAVSPTEPDDTDIRTAITADGADGLHAYYVILASVTIASGTTDITSGMITPGERTEVPLISTDLSEPTSLAFVDTINIVDKAVTDDKIDFTTIQGGNMPIAASPMQIPYLSAGDSMILWRIGNIVFALANVVVSSLGTYDSSGAIETMPSGFRPATGTKGVFIMSAVAGGGNSTMGVIISPDGSVTFSNRAAISASTRFYGHGCWITKDAWPN